MNNLIENNRWGFLRETKELAEKAGIDKDCTEQEWRII